MSLRFSFSDFDEDQGILNGYFDPIKEAATNAMRGMSEVAKNAGRAEIARAGFGKKWQNALRAENYPKRQFSANAAAWLYHRIPYAGVFEQGAQIRGKPYLWLPLSSTPKLGQNKRLTPRSFQAAYATKLVPMKNAAKPILGAPMSVTKAAARKGPPYKITKAALRRGATAQGVIRTVPVFVGVDTVSIRKRFDLARVFSAAADRLPALYLDNLKA
jgi:hypothetical protein